MDVNGEKIKAIREEREKTQDCIAEAAGRTRKWVQLVEQGKLVKLNRNIALAIARRLNCRLEDIAKG